MAERNSYFQFKQFTVQQPHCAMKVGTDGVLLGAWAAEGLQSIEPKERCADADDTSVCGAQECGTQVYGEKECGASVYGAQEEQGGQEGQEGLEHSPRLLDIGSGSGVVALIAAQCHPTIRIDAIEPHAESCLDARYNFAHSPWSERLQLYQSSLQEFNPPHRYDHIWSNPPYFVDSLSCPDPARNAARHTSSLPFEELLRGVVRLLKPSGSLTLILPTAEQELFAELAKGQGLYTTQKLEVRSTPLSKTIRTIVRYRFQAAPIASEPQSEQGSLSVCPTKVLAIRSGVENLYSEAYRELTRDFYLKF